jgi:hypothetical protein
LTETVLGVGIALLGSCGIPQKRLLEIRFSAPTLINGGASPKLRARFAFAGPSEKPVEVYRG